MAELLRQAGGIVYKRDEAGVLRVLLVSSTRRRGVWLFPKGDIDRGESPLDAAWRETWEEAGVKAEVLESVGRIRYRDPPFDVDLELFLMHLREQSVASPEGRKRRWVTLAEASGLHHLGPGIGQVLRTTRAALRRLRA